MLENPLPGLGRLLALTLVGMDCPDHQERLWRSGVIAISTYKRIEGCKGCFALLQGVLRATHPIVRGRQVAALRILAHKGLKPRECALEIP